MSITVRSVTATPAMAKEWMSRNEGNRNLRAARVSKYAADMAASRWQQNGDTFKFDKTGRLIDGQHRCAAIIESGIDLDVIVVEGLEPESSQTLDAGAHRSPADALFFAGEIKQHTKDIAASLNAWNAWTSGALVTCNSAGGGTTKLSNAAMVESWQHNKHVAAAAIEAKALYQRGIRLPVGAIAVALIELRARDFNVANDFFEAIAELRTTGKGDPIHTFITRMHDETAARRPLLAGKALFMLFRTWNAYVKNERLVKLQFGSSENGWAPIPEPCHVPAKFHRGDSPLAVIA